MKRAFLYTLLLVCPMVGHAQIELRTEAQVTAGTGDHSPLWLNANKYGLSSLDKTNGYVRVGAFRSLENDSTKEWKWGAGADVAVAAGFTSTLVVQQAYGELKWLKGLLTVGSKEQPLELKNQELSSGAQTLGVNARPVPSVRLSLPEYWTVPYTKGWLGLKGHIAYGMTTDDGWQKDFTHQQSKYTEHTKLHTKAGYLRIGQAEKPVSVELGLEMACQYGGTSYVDRGEGIMPMKNEDGIKGMFRSLIPSGGDVPEGIYANASGNHLGSYLARVNFDYDNWYLGLYADHFFEDQSQMFFIDYDGYGQGDEFDKKKDNRWFVYDLKDMMLGAELRLKNFKWLNNIVVEYLYTKYQSGPVYHDRTPNESTHISGRDYYYNHSIFTGWQHWGQVMGNPLYRSPLYNDNGWIHVFNNRFIAWHLGLSGDPLENLHYRLLTTYQKGWGTYDYLLPDPQENVSLLAEATYSFPATSTFRGWTVKGALGLDSGELYSDQGKTTNFGCQLTVRKSFDLNIKK